MLNIRDLTGEQLKMYIDASELAKSLFSAEEEYYRSYNNVSLFYKKQSGEEYLIRKSKGVQKSLGRKTAETDNQKRGFDERKNVLKNEIEQFKSGLDKLRPFIRLHGLGRSPAIVGKIARKFKKEKILGKNVFFAGTHCLYAYESTAGIRFQEDILSTSDVDFLVDDRKKIKIAANEETQPTVMKWISDIDRSMKLTGKKSFRAINRDHFMVEFICPKSKNYLLKDEVSLSGDEDDFYPATIDGLQWLINSPKLNSICFDEKGLPFEISCVDPRIYALHKLWLSSNETREPVKKSRDKEQAISVAKVVNSRTNLKWDMTELSALPEILLDGIDALKDERLIDDSSDW